MSPRCGQSAIPADGQGVGSASTPVWISTLSNKVVFPAEDVKAWSCGAWNCNPCPYTPCCSHTSMQCLKGFHLICSPSCSVPLAPGLTLGWVSLACHALQWRCGQDHVSSAWLSVPFSPLWHLVANTWENTSGCCCQGKNFQKYLQSCGTVKNHNVGTSEWSCRSPAEVNLSAQVPLHLNRCPRVRWKEQSWSLILFQPQKSPHSQVPHKSIRPWWTGIHMPQPHETNMTVKSLPFNVSCTKKPLLSSEMPASVWRLYLGSSVVPVCVICLTESQIKACKLYLHLFKISSYMSHETISLAITRY